MDLGEFTAVVENGMLVVANTLVTTEPIEMGDNNALAVTVTVLSDSAGTLVVRLDGSNNLVNWAQWSGTNKIGENDVVTPSAPGVAVTNIGKITTAYVRIRASHTSGTCVFNIAVRPLKR